MTKRNEIVSYVGLLITLVVSLAFLVEQLASYGLLG
jgi:hypothetical protein